VFLPRPPRRDIVADADGMGRALARDMRGTSSRILGELRQRIDRTMTMSSVKPVGARRA
jgi:hypothetical protein